MELVIAAILALVGLLTALAALRDQPPVKWVLHRLVAQPLEEVFDRKVEETTSPIVEKLNFLYSEMHPNLGSSMRDAINRTESKVTGVDMKVEQVDDKLGEVGARVDRLEGAVSVLSHRPSSS